MDIVNSLRAELAQLQASLAADPRMVKIQKIKDLLSIYEAPTAASVQAATPFKPIEPAPPNPLDRVRNRVRAESKATKVKEAVIALLAPRGKVHRTEILGSLQAAGLMGGEKNPMAQLAAYLSEWAEFEGDGQGNWSLASNPSEIQQANPAVSDRSQANGSGSAETGQPGVSTPAAPMKADIFS